MELSYRLGRGVITRFEPGLEGGTLFVFVPHGGRILEGNKAAWQIMEVILRGQELERLATDLAQEPLVSAEEALDEIRQYVAYLVDKGVLEVCP